MNERYNSRKRLDLLIEKTIKRIEDWTGTNAVSVEALEEFNVVVKELCALNEELKCQNETDIEIHKGLELEKDRSEGRARKLQVQNAELEKFAKVAAHDLQEPIRAVSAYAQLLKDNHSGSLNTEAETMLSFICESAETALSRIQGVLNYATVDAIEFDSEEIATGDLVESIVQRVIPDLEAKGIQLNVEQLPLVRADYDRLEVVFENLITNAIKFSRKESPKIWISAEKQASFWQFSVRDDGIGFDQRFADKVFMLFHRLNANDPNFPGSGIGLAVTKKIVEQHGGRIWAISEPGNGANFFFTLPL